MERMYDHAKDQERWNEYGKKLAKDIEENPEKFIIDKDIFPLPQRLYKQ
jgi:hypothetical protein